MKTCRRCIHFGKVKKKHFYICHKSKELFPHGKIPKACKFYEVKPGPYIGSYIDYDEIEDMKFVESLRGNYPDSTFWILGTDPNLDRYPDNFFNGKLSVALNIAFLAFPSSTYFCTAHTRVPEAIVDKLGYDYLASKCIFIAVARKPRDTELILWWEDWGLDPIYAKVLKKPYLKQDDEDKEKMVEQLTNDGPFELIDCRGILNYTIQIVALLGAKKIILVGCSARGTDRYLHAQTRGMSEFYPEPLGYRPMWRAGLAGPQVTIKKETMMLVRLLKKHNIEFMRHRFDEKKGEFIFKEIEERAMMCGKESDESD